MDFNWGWLRRGKNSEFRGKSREHDTSDENKNPKHRRRSWADVAKGSRRLRRLSQLQSTQGLLTTLTLRPCSRVKRGPAYKEKQKEDKGESWTEARIRSSSGRVRERTSGMVGQMRKISTSQKQQWGGMLDMRLYRAFQGLMPVHRCRFCKVLGYKIVECPVIPTKMKSPEFQARSQKVATPRRVVQKGKGKQPMPRQKSGYEANIELKEGKPRVTAKMADRGEISQPKLHNMEVRSK